MATYEFWTNDWREPPLGKKGYVAMVHRELGEEYIFPTTDDTIFINGVEREVFKVAGSMVCSQGVPAEIPQQILVWVKR